MIDVLNDAVKAVVNYRFVGGVTEIGFQLMAQSTARRAKSHMIDNRGRTATGRCAGAGKKIVAAAGQTGINVEMGMNIHAAGHHVAAAGVNDFTGLFNGYLFGQLADQAIFNEQVLSGPSVGVDDSAVFNQYAHINSRLPPRAAGGIEDYSDSVASQLSGIAAYIAAQVTR